MPRSFTFATITEYKAAKGNSGAIYAELVSSGIKSGSCVSKITATGDVFIDSINPFVTPELGQEGDTLYYNSSEDTYRFLRAGNTTWDADSYGQVFIDLAKIPSGFSVVAPYTDIFNFKQTDENIGSGKASMTKILGNTVAWNQMQVALTSPSTVYINSGSSYKGDNKYWTFTASARNGNINDYPQRVTLLSGHKYYMSTVYKGTTAGNYLIINSTTVEISTSWRNYSRIVDGTGQTFYFQWQDSRSGGWDAIYIMDNPQVVDLTLLYGPAIDGMTNAQILAKFESEFPGYHSYNAGTLISNKAKAIEFVGFNQWDEETRLGYYNSSGVYVPGSNVLCSKNLIRVSPNTNYYSSYLINVMCYDINGKFISSILNYNNNFTTLDGCCYIAFTIHPNYGTTYHHDICINLSGKRNGQYEPYKKVVLPLPNLDQIKVYSHNLWDEEWENGYLDPGTGTSHADANHIRPKNFISVEAGVTYFFNRGSVGGYRVFFFDANKNYLDNTDVINVSNTFTTPYGCAYIKFHINTHPTYNHDICINLSSSFNGQYEPHGILTKFLKGKGSWADEYAGKFYEKAWRVNLGDLSWGYVSAYGYKTNASLVGIIKPPASLDVTPNVISAKYIPLAQNAPDQPGKLIVLSDGNIWIKADSGDTISGYMDYELATPIEYEIYSPTKMPFNWKYRVSEYHTKKMLPENGEYLTSAPFACEIKQI